MKNLFYTLFASAVLLTATSVQAQQTYVKANIPFDFAVGGRAFPAGDYTVKSISQNGVMRIDDDQESAKAISLSNTCTSSTPASTTKLVFHRLGDHYFLYQVWTEGNSSGREFPMSKAEVQIAQNSHKAELVIVAANVTR
jgi:hypothetical protein